MWILVVGSSAILDRDDGGAAALTELGCRVKPLDLWDSLDDPEFLENPPAAVLVEALDQFDAGRAALVRIRAVEALSAVPTLCNFCFGCGVCLQGGSVRCLTGGTGRAPHTSTPLRAGGARTGGAFLRQVRVRPAR